MYIRNGIGYIYMPSVNNNSQVNAAAAESGRGRTRLRPLEIFGGRREGDDRIYICMRMDLYNI